MTSEYPPATVLIVDDEAVNRRLLDRVLSQAGFASAAVGSGEEALDVLRQQEFALVLLDIELPGMNGFEVARAIHETPELAELPVVFLSGHADISDRLKGFEVGGVDFVAKPFQPEEVQARVRVHVELRRLRAELEAKNATIRRHAEHLEEQVTSAVLESTQARTSIILALSKLAESRDPETGEHLLRMREYCRILAEELAKQARYADEITPAYIENLYAASPLHDIGKVGIPDRILLKPGKLTTEEFEVMKRHAEIGAETLREVEQSHPGNPFVGLGMAIAATHHERWDGTGYPGGLAGEDIPICGRILSLGDVYDALTSKRVYKEAFSHEKSRAIILEGRGSQFDLAVVDAFIATEHLFREVRERVIDKPKVMEV